MRNLTLAELQKAWPDADLRLIAGIIAAQPAVYPRHGITTALRLAHFMAQVSHESGCGTEMVENMNYTAKRMMQVWPKRFPTIRSTEGLDHNPEALANRVYQGRMGNTQKGDGFRFRGRGLIQTTGRNGYAELAKLTGLPLLDHPEMVNDPAHALECAAAEFASYKGLLEACDRDDIEAVTRLINGGLVGLNERRAELRRWKSVLGI